MRVLQANKFFYVRGGAERYFMDLVHLLPDYGHPVAPFSMHHPRNEASTFSRHFVSHVDYSVSAGPFGSVATAARTIYNRQTRKQVRALIEEFKPDLAHLHNVHHQLSGSLFEALHDAGVPIVQTLHDFQWVCPVYTFLRHGEVCGECGHGRYFAAVRHRCHSRSLGRSLVAAMELRVGHLRGWEGKVSRFLAPSTFLAEKVIEHGLPKEKVRSLGYCLRLDGYRTEGERGNHALYAGRLSREKGVGTLLEALSRVPGLHLRVAGTGPLEPELRQKADRLVPGRVDFLGHLNAESLRAEVAAAAFVVVPSEWYENQPFAVLEAFALATPVLGSNLGGIPELIAPGERGELFSAGSATSLAEGLAVMQAHPRRREMGCTAQQWVQEVFDPARHVQQLMEVYREVMA